jgi:hypothetical protein
MGHVDSFTKYAVYTVDLTAQPSAVRSGKHYTFWVQLSGRSLLSAGFGTDVGMNPFLSHSIAVAKKLRVLYVLVSPARLVLRGWM